MIPMHRKNIHKIGTDNTKIEIINPRKSTNTYLSSYIFLLQYYKSEIALIILRISEKSKSS